MLINLEATNENENLILQLPYLVFKNSNVTLTELFIKWKTATTVNGFISTTLVDKNSFNPKQIIFLFCQEKESVYLHCKPTQFQTYKIQRTELQSAEFKINISDKEKLKKIEKIFIQLKITDAGLQQRSELEIQ